MQFVVPQFIDVESKIIGPVTPRQFITLIITAGLIFISYKLADFTLFLIEGVAILILGITISFVKVNGRPIYYFFLDLINLAKKPSLRVWNREERAIEKEYNIKEKEEREEEKKAVTKPPISTSQLSQIALMVDTGGRYEEPLKEKQENNN